ncbi:glutamine synthetase [bacterium]|nr:glutamine synthetase [bacterium]
MPQDTPYSALLHPGILADEGQLLPSSRLERMFGKSPDQWTADDLIEFVREHRIRVVSLMHIGGDGDLKTLDFVPRDFMHLRDVITGGERADGSSLFGMMGIQTGKSDIVLRPRVRSAFLNPFSPVPTLSLLCGHFGPNGLPLPESPDTIVRYAYERARSQTGVELHALGEVEYFLGKTPEAEDVYASNDRGYHTTSPFVFGETLRREAMVLLAEMGVPIKYSHSEVGFIEASEEDNTIWEQHEIELALQPLPLAAEAVALTMWTLRNLAHQKGMRCSFAPVVRAGHAGSGMHFHTSPVVDGEHVGGFDEDGKPDEPAKWLIAGLSHVGGALMTFGNRVPSSFVRLSQGKEAPNTVTWGQFNRKALIRIPILATDENGRYVSPPTVEFRLPDGSAHPHLLLAGIAQGMIAGHSLDDLDDRLEQTAALTAEKHPEALVKVPRSFGEVATALTETRGLFEAGKVFPEHVIDRLIENLKTIE